jgi:phage virion morphogenesis protein
MAGTVLVFSSNSDAISSSIRLIERKLGNLQPALAIIGETVKTSVVRNFEKGGRPAGWQELAPATLARKKGGATLIGKGHAGGLMGSIHSEIGPKSVMVGTDKVYGAIHQFGGLVGRGGKVKIPARPYLLVQEEDWTEINDQLGDYILQGKL